MEQQKRRTDAVLWIAVPMGLAMVYALSIGPVAALYFGGMIPESLALTYVAPLQWVYDNCPPLQAPIQWYVQLFL